MIRLENLRETGLIWDKYIINMANICENFLCRGEGFKIEGATFEKYVREDGPW